MDRSPETPGLDYYACTGCDEELHLGFDSNWRDSRGFQNCQCGTRQIGKTVHRSGLVPHDPKIVQREFAQAVIF